MLIHQLRPNHGATVGCKPAYAQELFSRYGQSVLVAQKRASRFVLLAELPSSQAKPTAAQLHCWPTPLPPQLRRTLTQDNGTAFALHHNLRDALGINTYFCNPHSPWQKGGIENANGRVRRFLLRRTNLLHCSPRQIDAIARQCNNTPASASASKPQLSNSTITCCTSNVNPPDVDQPHGGIRRLDRHQQQDRA